MEITSLNEPADKDIMLGALLRTCYQALMGEFESGLAAAGYPDIRLSHTPVLQPLSLRREGMWARELADLAGMTKPSMGYLIADLEAHGYVERVADPSDKRAQLVRLTTRGWEMSRVGRQLVRQAEAQWAELVGDQAIADLRSRLQSLVLALEKTTSMASGSKR